MELGAHLQPNVWAMTKENLDFAYPIFEPYLNYGAPNIRLLPTPLPFEIGTNAGFPSCPAFQTLQCNGVRKGLAAKNDFGRSCD